MPQQARDEDETGSRVGASSSPALALAERPWRGPGPCTRCHACVIRSGPEQRVASALADALRRGGVATGNETSADLRGPRLPIARGPHGLSGRASGGCATSPLI